jgi:hypothetical protein
MADLEAVVTRLREERGLSLRALAKAIHHDPTYLSRCLRGVKPCGPAMARLIDEALGADGQVIEAAVRMPLPAAATEGSRRLREALDIMTWVTGTNASDDAIAELASTTAYLAEAHSRTPAAMILPEVLGASGHEKIRVCGQLAPGSRSSFLQSCGH